MTKVPFYIVLAMSNEATDVSILLRARFPEISVPLIGSIIIIGVSLINLLGADRLSKLESGLALIQQEDVHFQEKKVLHTPFFLEIYLCSSP
jgi:hypothetical protein